TAENEQKTPAMIHRALFGSLERFIGILIEHYGGESPFWLSPVQVRVVPVGAGHRDAARELGATLREAGYRVEVDDRDDTVGKRIRDAELEKIPYTIVYGDRESDDSLAIRERHGAQSTKSLDELLKELATLCSLKSRSGPVPHPQDRGPIGGSTESKRTRKRAAARSGFVVLEGGAGSLVRSS